MITKSVLTILANSCLVYLVVRIITEEDITEKFRVFFVKRLPRLYDLLSCFFCLSCWASLVVSLLFPSGIGNFLQDAAMYIVVAMMINLAMNPFQNIRS